MPVKYLLAAIATLLALAVPTAATAAPTAVDVRVEGRDATIWSGSVITDGKIVSTPSGGSHLCDGTNFGANPTPGPTPTTALSDAAVKGGFTWDAKWYDSFSDFAIDRVGPDAATASEFWGVFVNGSMGLGGCQEIVKAGDEVLWAFDAFSKTGGALALAAPETALVGDPVVVRATAVDGGAPVAGATVRGVPTGADGTATLTFAEPGIYPLKADKSDMVRSRASQLCVDPPLADPCSSGDKAAPTAVLEAPAISSSTARFDWVRLSWLGDDADGSGIRRYTVQQRRVDRPDLPWRTVVADSALTEKRFRGREGGAYEIRVQAFDRASNGSGWVTATTLVPFDNLSARVRFSKRGWKALRRHGAFKRSVHRAVRRGASARLRFTGTRATLVTRALPRGGRLRITAGGKSRVVSLKGRGRFRTKLVATPELEPGRHVLRIASLGRAPVEVDAIAIHP